MLRCGSYWRSGGAAGGNCCELRAASQSQKYPRLIMIVIPHAPSTMKEGEVDSPAEHTERPTHASYEGSGGRENACGFGVECWLAAHGATLRVRTLLRKDWLPEN
jgi:hypothetical protein